MTVLWLTIDKHRSTMARYAIRDSCGLIGVILLFTNNEKRDDKHTNYLRDCYHHLKNWRYEDIPTFLLPIAAIWSNKIDQFSSLTTKDLIIYFWDKNGFKWPLNSLLLALVLSFKEWNQVSNLQLSCMQ